MKSSVSPAVTAVIIAIVVVVVVAIGYKVIAKPGNSKAADKAMESQYTHGGSVKMDASNAPSMSNRTPPPGAKMPGGVNGGPPPMGR